MKELLFGLLAFICALVISALIIIPGFIYTICYGIWFSRKAKKGNRWTDFFRYLWRVADGYCAALGHLFYQGAYAQDLIWNVNGEMIEDAITA